jgi:hypothetical protein
MIEKLFDFDSYDEVGDFAITHYDCHLKQDIGEFKKGAHVGMITVDYVKGFIEVMDVDESNIETIKRYKINFVIGEEIKTNG